MRSWRLRPEGGGCGTPQPAGFGLGPNRQSVSLPFPELGSSSCALGVSTWERPRTALSLWIRAHRRCPPSHPIPATEKLRPSEGPEPAPDPLWAPPRLSPAGRCRRAGWFPGIERQTKASNPGVGRGDYFLHNPRGQPLKCEVRPQEAGPRKLHQSQTGGCLRPVLRNSDAAPPQKISNLGDCVSLLEPVRLQARC